MSLQFSEDPYLAPEQRSPPVVDFETYRMARSLDNPRVPMTWLLLGINGLAALALLCHLGWFPGEKSMLALLSRAGANRRGEILEQGEYWRLLASAFLHVGWLHLLCNLYALSILGKLVENLFGPYRVWLLYMVSAVSGSLASLLTTLHRAPASLSAGASGAIFGLMGAVLVFYLRCRKQIPAPLRSFFLQFFGVLALNIYLGIRIPVVDNAAHLGGLAGGATLTLVFFRIHRVGRGWRVAEKFVTLASGAAGLYVVIVMASRLW